MKARRRSKNVGTTKVNEDRSSSTESLPQSFLRGSGAFQPSPDPSHCESWIPFSPIAQAY